jgi:Glycosyltransferase
VARRADVVCGPALIEPFGQALLEAMAAGRSVVATRVGGPPEFVPADAGVLVDPLDETELARALERAASLPSPNEAARAAAAEHDVRRQAERVEAILLRAARRREPDLDERADAVLQPGLAGDRERPLVGLAHLVAETPCLSRLSPVIKRSWICCLAVTSSMVHKVETWPTVFAW